MLRVHFLNVGHGDCTIIEHPSGNLTMIDINNAEDLDATSAGEIAIETPSSIDDRLLSLAEAVGMRKAAVLREAGYDIPLTNPIEFLARNYHGRTLFRYIQTHPDLDHMRGLRALRDHGVGVSNVWDTVHAKVPDFRSASDREDWQCYQDLQSGTWGGNAVLRLNRGSRGHYYNRTPEGLAGGDGFHILAPTPPLNQSANRSGNSNNLSYVLWLEYRGIKVVLGGDAEEDVWEDIANYYGSNLSCNVLKASHHGRESGYHQRAVEHMSPQFTVVSVGKKPNTDASNRYRQYSDEVWSTRWRGDITLVINDDGSASMTSEYDR